MLDRRRLGCQWVPARPSEVGPDRVSRCPIEVGARVDGGRQLPRDDPPAGDPLRGRSHPGAVVPGSPGRTPTVERFEDDRRALGAGQRLGGPEDEHAPATAGARVELVDLEAHLRVLRRRELRPGMGADDDRGAVEPEVDREDQRPVLGVDRQPADLGRGQEGVALVLGEHGEHRLPLVG